jgi:hypothetical protein
VSATEAKEAGPQPRPSRARLLLRASFRCLRVTVLLLLLIVIVLGLFLNKVGLPDAVKARVTAELRARGWVAEFSRLRLRWYRGLVVEDLQLRQAKAGVGPHLFIEMVECPIHYRALRNFNLEVKGVKLRGGRMIWPLQATNAARQTVILNNLVGDVRFKPNDVWQLLALRGDFQGMPIKLEGTLTNASALRAWKWPAPSGPASARLEALRRELLDGVHQLHFTRPPELFGEFSGDARHTQTFAARLRFLASDLGCPWGNATNFALNTRLFPPRRPSDHVQVEVRMEADELHTRWAEGRQISFRAPFEPWSFQPLPTNLMAALQAVALRTRWGAATNVMVTAEVHAKPASSNTLETMFTFQAKTVQTEWGQGSNATFSASVQHTRSNWLPATVNIDLESERLRTRWGDARQGELSATGSLPSASDLQLFHTNLTWPDRWTNVPCDVTLLLSNVHSPKLQWHNFSGTAHWQPPYLGSEISSELYEGRSSLKTDLDVATRELRFAGSTSFDLSHTFPLFPTNIQQWLNNYHSQTPPQLEVDGRLTLPSWTNHAPDWIGDVTPSLELRGKFQAGAGAYGGVTFTSAQSLFSLTNSAWRISDLKVERPEGMLEGQYTSDTDTHQFHGRVRSTIDAKAVRPWLEKEGPQRALDFFEFTTPPLIEGQVWGNWLDLDHISFAAWVAATNFIFRGESVKDCRTTLVYTNEFLSFIAPEVQRVGERGTATGIGLDPVAQKLYLTNAVGNINAYAITRAVGQAATEAIEPYRFDSSPTGRAYGTLDLKGGRHEDDVHFEVKGGPFHWRAFHLPQLSGRVDWVGETVALTNVHGDFHGGRLAGNAFFDFRPTNGAAFTFHSMFTNADLHSFMADFSNKTNKVEGIVKGELVVTHANTAEPLSWQGYGTMNLTNGLIWDIPVFGLFSPILNSIAPGLGNSRAKKASATYVITNSLIQSSDLQVHATAMRMKYDLSVDFDGGIEGRVEAELLRDMPAVGFVFSKIFWPVTKLFEYKLSGTLAHPKAQPLFFIPRILQLPFHPIKTIREIMPENSKKQNRTE